MVFKKVHPNREKWAREAESEAERARVEAGQHANPRANSLLHAVAQLLDGRAAALRRNGPVEVIEPDTKRHLLTYADGTYHVITEG